MAASKTSILISTHGYKEPILIRYWLNSTNNQLHFTITQRLFYSICIRQCLILLMNILIIHF